MTQLLMLQSPSLIWQNFQEVDRRESSLTDPSVLLTKRIHSIIQQCLFCAIQEKCISSTVFKISFYAQTGSVKPEYLLAFNNAVDRQFLKIELLNSKKLQITFNDFTLQKYWKEILEYLILAFFGDINQLQERFVPIYSSPQEQTQIQDCIDHLMGGVTFVFLSPEKRRYANYHLNTSPAQSASYHRRTSSREEFFLDNSYDFRQSTEDAYRLRERMEAHFDNRIIFFFKMLIFYYKKAEGIELFFSTFKESKTLYQIGQGDHLIDNRGVTNQFQAAHSAIFSGIEPVSFPTLEEFKRFLQNSINKQHLALYLNRFAMDESLVHSADDVVLTDLLNQIKKSFSIPITSELGQELASTVFLPDYCNQFDGLIEANLRENCVNFLKEAVLGHSPKVIVEKFGKSLYRAINLILKDKIKDLEILQKRASFYNDIYQFLYEPINRTVNGSIDYSQVFSRFCYINRIHGTKDLVDAKKLFREYLEYKDREPNPFDSCLKKISDQYSEFLIIQLNPYLQQLNEFKLLHQDCRAYILELVNSYHRSLISKGHDHLTFHKQKISELKIVLQSNHIGENDFIDQLQMIQQKLIEALYLPSYGEDPAFKQYFEWLPASKLNGRPELKITGMPINNLETAIKSLTVLIDLLSKKSQYCSWNELCVEPNDTLKNDFLNLIASIQDKQSSIRDQIEVTHRNIELAKFYIGRILKGLGSNVAAITSDQLTSYLDDQFTSYYQQLFLRGVVPEDIENHLQLMQREMIKAKYIVEDRKVEAIVANMHLEGRLIVFELSSVDVSPKYPLGLRLRSSNPEVCKTSRLFHLQFQTFCEQVQLEDLKQDPNMCVQGAIWI